LPRTPAVAGVTTGLSCTNHEPDRLAATSEKGAVSEAAMSNPAFKFDHVHIISDSP